MTNLRCQGISAGSGEASKVTELTKKQQQELRHILSDKIHFCGCGSDEAKWVLLQKLLERAEDQQVGDPGYYAPLNDIPGYAVEFMAHALDGWGLIEHGTSIGYCWLTTRGEKVLAWLRLHGTDDVTWPEFWFSTDDEW